MIKFYIALYLAKLSIPLLKITKHNGTNFPGEVALKICPDFIKYIDKPTRNIAVTGTNGKTTITNMICDCLTKENVQYIDNRSGSNISSGISTTLLKGVNICNKCQYSLGVFEIDERSSLRVYPYLHPEIIVISNLFRDSIMRNAHPHYIADFLNEAINHQCTLIINADDIIACEVGKDNPKVFFGIDKLDTDLTEPENLINDAQICPLCHHKLEYKFLRYHHIGKVYCPNCGFKSNEPDYLGSNVNLDKKTMTLTYLNQNIEIKLISDSLVNAYNSLATIATLKQMGYDLDKAIELVSSIEITKTRHNVYETPNNNIIMQMAKEKNALACTRTFDYVAKRKGPKKELFLMMNCLGDQDHWSENMCWLYDCDFEYLLDDSISQIVCTGPRALDYQLRLLLAGINKEKIVVQLNEHEAVKQLNYTKGEDIYIFYGTDSLNLAFTIQKEIVKCAQEKR
ncbi:MAG: MurT ligase domain-containing protein [Erysipelotrichaceae bacterium]